MPKQTNFVRTQIRIPKDLNASIEEFAGNNDLSKNEAMLFLMMKGFEQVKMIERARESYSEPAKPIFEMISMAVEQAEKSKIKD